MQLISVLQGRVPLVILYISWGLAFGAQQLNDSNCCVSLVDLGVWKRKQSLNCQMQHRIAQSVLVEHQLAQAGVEALAIVLENLFITI